MTNKCKTIPELNRKYFCFQDKDMRPIRVEEVFLVNDIKGIKSKKR